MRPMHETAIINPMAHQRSSQPRLSPSSYEEDIRAVLAPRLAYFEAVARHEHVTRAAHELGVPQSTLSRAMVRLEADLGVALFARKGRTVSLTPAGRTFLTSAERALAEVEKAADAVRADADLTTGRVSFGFLHTMGSACPP
ncbi:LysR family transcriptional regulator OS=Streptomyces microflavus OX=1919 GN=G3I39_01340 PE=3 SV=1 [Streptomyces microflavus]